MPLAQLAPGPDAADASEQARVSVRIRGAFVPELVVVRAGERLRLVFRREETAACSERIVFPSLGKSIMLPPFVDVPVDLGALPPGRYEFGCELGVLRGRIVVPARPRTGLRQGERNH